MVRHGVYWRRPRDEDQVYEIPIQRWLCKSCRRTVSVLPDFLLSYRWYALTVIREVLVARYEQGARWKDLAARLGQWLAIRTQQRWCEAFAKRAPGWLGRVQRTLAEQDSGSPWLDPQGEAVQAANPAVALLRASLHLLAWAKSSWEELVGYGHNERLRFLWLWGAGQGIGRLV